MDFKFTVALPEINAVSEKQRAYAEDLRSNYMNTAINNIQKRIDKCIDMCNNDEIKVNEQLKAAGFENLQEYGEKILCKDKFAKMLLTETSARNIIDRL